MTADAVLEAVDALTAAGVRFWLDGGWGVDALLGEQTRDHADLDLIIDDADVGRLRAALGALGYTEVPDASATSFVLVRDRDDRIDVHPIPFDAAGVGRFDLGDGRRWPFPPRAFTGRGRVRDRDVPCLTADAQVQCHAQGYAPTENDLGDMERLQERFGVVLPIALCREAGAR